MPSPSPDTEMSQEKENKSESSSERNLRWQGLISRIAGGDEGALGDLYDESNRLLYSLAFNILSDSDDSKEVILDVFKYVWKSASGYNPGQSNPSTWLVMLTRSRSIDKLRRRRPSIELSEVPELEAPGSVESPENAVMGLETRKIVLHALSELSPKQKRVVELSYFSQLNQSEISEMLDIPVGSVKSTLRLAKDKLRNMLAKLDNLR